VIYISAYTVYPNVDGKIVDEQTPLMRRHPKVNIMIDAEEVILDQIPHSVVLRLGWLVNPGLDWHKTLENFRKFLPNYELKGDGKIRANLVHIEDAARAIEFAISNNLSGIYNICDDAHPYTGELYDIVAEQVGMPPPNWNKEAKEVLIYEGNNIASNQKIKDAGFSFKYPREMGLLYILPNK
jgi:nucleoside-diphosphate-sugar epimerase